MKRFFCLFLCFIFLSTSIFSGKFNKVAYADALTTSMVGASAVALMSDWGISFSSVDADASNMQNVFDTRIEEYVNSHGGSLQGLFGYEVARAVEGKLVVGYQLYNGVIDFIDYVQETYNDVLSYGNYGDDVVPSYYPAASVDINPNGCSVLFTDYYESTSLSGFKKINVYNRGSNVYSHTADGYYYIYPGSWQIVPDNSYIYCRFNILQRGGTTDYGQVSIGSISSLSNKLSYDDTSYVKPTVLNPDKEWSGTIGGQAIPDTNLDQLIGEIYEQIADNNIDIDGEIIDIPVPPGPVPTWTPVDDVIDGINQGGEVITDIGNDIGDISGHLDDLGEIGGDIVDQLEGVNQGIQSQTGVLSGAIDQAVSDVQDAILEQTQALSQSATATAAATESIAEAVEDEAIDWQKFDLRGLFPFCIPFDIYNMLKALDASPAAPHVQLPFVIESIGFSYMLDLDFSIFDPVASILRQMELICYGLALAWATSKVIKW